MFSSYKETIKATVPKKELLSLAGCIATAALLNVGLFTIDPGLGLTMATSFGLIAYSQKKFLERMGVTSSKDDLDDNIQQFIDDVSEFIRSDKIDINVLIKVANQ